MFLSYKFIKILRFKFIIICFLFGLFFYGDSFAQKNFLVPNTIQTLMLCYKASSKSINPEEWAKKSTLVSSSDQFKREGLIFSEIDNIKINLQKVEDTENFRIMMHSSVSDYDDQNEEYAFLNMTDGAIIGFDIDYFGYTSSNDIYRRVSIRLVNASEKQFWPVDKQKAEVFNNQNRHTGVILDVLLKPIPNSGEFQNRECRFEAEVLEYDIGGNGRVWGSVK